jgi:signal transduction histidine kinase/CheY-like chemotaxis protein
MTSGAPDTQQDLIGGSLNQSRAFILLRYTLIVATAYLLLVEEDFQMPSRIVVLLIAGALASNVALAQLSARILESTILGACIILFDTLWVTAILLQSDQLNNEFFYIYFFVLLLAAMGENLPLIIIGTLVVCAAYLYGLSATGRTWALWSSPSLIRIPFLFTAAAFYGHLVDRVRQERRRAAVEAQTVAELRLGERELRKMQDVLEARVAERTAELMRSNELLLQEINERKRAEEQLRQAQKLEAVGRLAGGVAHDFNNQLFVINGYSELLLEHLQDNRALRPLVEEVKKAGERGAALTRKLLAFSRKQILEPKVVDLNAELADLEKVLRRLIGEDIELQVIQHDGLWPVRVDPGQLEQVVLNLAVNARDAMPRGGRLTIETANVELDNAYARSHADDVSAGAYALLSVTDTGHGMDQETLSHIFEPFFTTKEVGKGTGLGLSTVHGIVKQSGGHIEVTSKIGQGTAFRIYLPRAEAAPQEAQRPAAAELTASASETILLVEDEAPVRAFVRETLKRNGYRVLEARNGSEAIEIERCFRDKIDLMLTDVVMPQMSGRELADVLASKRPDMKVLYMSGYAEESVVHHGVLDDGITFLQKPCSVDTLLTKVRSVLVS